MAKKRSGSSSSKKSSARGTSKKTKKKAAPSSSTSGSTSPESSGSADIVNLHVWQFQPVRDLLVVAAVVGLVWAGYALRAVTVPLLIALLLAYLFEPLVARLIQHPKIERVHVVSGILAAGGLAIVIALAIAIPLLIHQTSQFAEDVRDGTLRQRADQAVQYLPATFQEEYRSVADMLFGEQQSVVEDGLDDEPVDVETDRDGATDLPTDDEMPPNVTAEQIDQQMLDAMINERIAVVLAEREAAAAAVADDDDGPDWVLIVRRSAETAIKIIGALIGIGLLLFLIPFYFFFFSMWYPQIIGFFHGLIPSARRDRSLYLLKRMDNVVAGFVRGRIVISLIMGILLAIGWAICSVPYSIPLGLLIGVFCAVPYLGAIGIPIAVGLLAFEQLGQPIDERMAWWLVILGPTIVFSIVQVIEGYVLTPAIAGKATNLDPVTILVAVLAGGFVLGVYGMLLAIPIAACGKILIQEVLLPKIHQWSAGEAKDPLPW